MKQKRFLFPSIQVNIRFLQDEIVIETPSERALIPYQFLESIEKIACKFDFVIDAFKNWRAKQLKRIVFPLIESL